MSKSLIALVAGVLAGAACVAIIWFVVDGAGDADDAEPPSEAARLEEFVAAWTEWRNASAAYEERLERSDAEGTVQYVEVVEVLKAGENSLVTSESAGRTSGGVDGQGISCSTDPDARDCFVEGEYTEGQDLTNEIDAIRRAIGRATHRLSFMGDGCWRIRRLADIESPVWGDQFDVCFDADNNVATSEVTTTELGVDTVTRTVRSTDVTTDDLRELIS